MKKKISKILLMLLICVLCCACGENDPKDSDTNGDAKEENKSEDVLKDYTDENGTTYKTVDADKLWELMENYDQISEEDKYIQIEVSMAFSSRVEAHDARAFLSFDNLETSSSEEGNRQLLDIEGCLIEENHYTVDETMSDIVYEKDEYTEMVEKFKAYESHEAVIIRGKIIRSDFTDSYHLDKEDANCYKIQVAVVGVAEAVE